MCVQRRERLTNHMRDGAHGLAGAQGLVGAALPRSGTGAASPRSGAGAQGLPVVLGPQGAAAGPACPGAQGLAPF